MNLRNALRYQGHPVKAYEYIALLLLQRGMYDQAFRVAQKVVGLQKDSAIGDFVLGWYWQWADNASLSRPLLDKADQLADGATRELLARVKTWPQPEKRPVQVTMAVLKQDKIAVFFAGPDGKPEGTQMADSLRRMLGAALTETRKFSIIGYPPEAGNAGSIEKAVETGKNEGCQAVIIGSIRQTGQTIEADARFIDVETAQALFATQGRAESPAQLADLAKSMAQEMAVKYTQTRKK
jgi:TolB-like protein